jgi:glycosyltransferase involved in cell wall biosynthesis
MIHGSDALRKIGVDVDCLFHDDLGTFPVRHQARRVVTPWLLVPIVVRRMAGGVRYDLVEIHEPLAAAYCALRRRVQLPPCALFCHGLEKGHWEAQLERWRATGEPKRLRSRIAVPLTLLPQSKYALSRADQVIVLTEEDAAYLQNRLGVSPDRISRVDNGAPAIQIERKRIPKTIRFLFFGSWLNRKGTVELVEASTLLHKSGLQFQLTIAGTGPTPNILEEFPGYMTARIRHLPLVEHAEIATLLADHDVLIAPAWYEGMPLTVLEAAAAGMALVLSDIGGHRQILRAQSGGKENGALLFRPSDGLALFEALLRLCRDHPLVSRLQQQARSIGTTLSWHHSALQLAAAYETAIEHASGPRNGRAAVKLCSAREVDRLNEVEEVAAPTMNGLSGNGRLAAIGGIDTRRRIRKWKQ